ncbi:zinc finger protein 469 [Rhinatrema bivittatum]|uniref:zinc finger protein 469 n=1 Tax=Rhinatrema bivittatum TaxID=194408 RepID=UPI00112913A6|nr:zinc finger protein 469 [Rhinatrema bivittatum]
MTGETQHAYPISEKESGSKVHQKDFAFEQLSDPDAKETPLHSGTNGVKDKGPPSQREAVIRPQQAGKIDFKSLHNRSKFSHESQWNSGKGCPPSPTGKNRARERNRRPGKCDRGQHQLYRLSITNSRANPTIGIAYPQQKVTPPKKPEASPTPAAGSYRFQVAGLPNREAGLQQEDLRFNRRFQEASASHYTSPTPAAPHHHPALKPQPRESSGAGGPLNYLEFQSNGTNAWHSAEKSFAAAGYGAQKSCQFPESTKSGSHCYGSVPFQYPFQSLQDVAASPFCGHTNGHNYLDVSLPNNQVAHAAFPFPTPSRDGQEEPLSNGTYDSLATKSRNYGLPAQQSRLLHSQTQGGQRQNSGPCYKGRNEHSTDLNGAISSPGAINPGAIDQTASTFQESQPVFASSEFSLHRNSNNLPVSASQRQPTPKDSVASQRLLDQGSSLRRNMPQNSLPQVHFQTKVYNNSSANSLNTGAVPFESSLLGTTQNHPRILQAWDGGSKSFTSVDQNPAPYPTPNGNQFSYQCQVISEQRLALTNARTPWQQGHLPSAGSHQNRNEPTQQLGSHKLLFPAETLEWQGSRNMQKSAPLNHPPGYQNQKHLSLPARQSCHCSHSFPSESGKDSTCDSRSSNVALGLDQSMSAVCSRNNASLAQPPAGLVAAVSPGQSPLPSPAPHPVANGLCSSLSPVSSSPSNTSSEESQLPITLPPSSFFHQGCYPKDSKMFGSSDSLNSSSLHYHQPESMQTMFSFSSDVPKDEHLFKGLQANPFQKQNTELAKGGLDSFESDPPPPPYSSHHLLANSLSSANLDQLDVLLTCKQCDQNYSNLTSFLEHRQHCGLHSVLQTEMRDAVKVAENRKHAVDLVKPSQVAQGLPLSKGVSDLHSHLLALNKIDFLLESENKMEAKDDPLKVSIVNGLTNSLSLNTFDLEIDDSLITEALDSLITEALNGLGYQSDNPEIDSSFIDVFADEELPSTKVTGIGQPYKVKEGLTSENKVEPTELDENQLFRDKTVNRCKKDNENIHQNNIRNSGIKNGDKRTIAPKFAEFESQPAIKELTQKNVVSHLLHNKSGSEKTTNLEMEKKASNNQVGSIPKSQGSLVKKHPINTEVSPGSADMAIANESSKPHRVVIKDRKKRKPRSGTWSKELIHKIVQQKNKLHKLHVKNNRSLQFSLVTERLLPKTPSSAFGEYDYISDSEEDLEYARMQAKKQLNGRLRYNFTRKHQGSKEGMKEKETIWRCSKKVEFQEQRRDPDNARIGRHNSRSSISSDQRTSISSESGSSPKSTERTESDNEKQTLLKSAEPNPSYSLTATERDPSAILSEDPPKENHVPETDVLKETMRFASANFPLISSKQFPSRSIKTSPSIKGNQCDSKELPLKSPLGTSYTEEATQEQQAAISHTESVPRTLSSGEYSPGVLMIQNSISQQFPSYNDNIVGYHTEGLISSSHVNNDMNCNINCSYDENGIKYLGNERRDFGSPADCYHADSTRVEVSVEGPASYGNDNNTAAYERKSLASPYDANLFSKPLVLGSPHISNVYLCPGDSINSFEQKHSDITPFTAETEQNKVASPLGFDTSSIFGEIAVPEFDSPLYDNVSTSEDNYVTYPCNQPSKSTLFEQPYSRFLQEKDWSLVEDISPVLPENAPHFQDIAVDKPLSPKHTVPPSDMPLSLSERISGCNVPFTTNMSVDELEIKRLVTELESQLQRSNINRETTVHPNSDTELGETSGQFSPRRRSHAEKDGKDLFLAADRHTSLLPAKSCVGQNLGSMEPPVLKESIDQETQKPSWDCSVEFASLESGIHPLTPEVSRDTCCTKEESGQFQETMNEAEVPKVKDSGVVNNEPSIVLPDSCLPDTSQKSDNQNYTTDLSKNSTITSDAVLPKMTEDVEQNPKDPLQSLQSRPTESTFLQHPNLEQTFDEKAGPGTFGNQVSALSLEFGLQDETGPVLNVASFACVECGSDSEERLLSKVHEADSLKTAAALKLVNNSSTYDDLEKQTDCRAKHLNRKPDTLKHSLFDAPSVEDKEVYTEDPKVSPDCTANPLQELQLFVARAVKHSQEELMVPCFPLLLSTTHQNPSINVPPEGRASCDPEIEAASDCLTGYVSGESERSDTLQEIKVASAGSESKEQTFSDVSEQLWQHSSAESSAAKLAEFVNHDLQNNITESPHLGDECSGLNDIKSKADGVSPEDKNRLSFSSATVNPLLGQAKKDDQMENLLEKDNNKTALTLEKHRQSAHAGCILFEKESSEDEVVEQTVNVHQGGHRSLPRDKSNPISPLSGPNNVQEGPEPASLCMAGSGSSSPRDLCEDLKKSRLAHETNAQPPSAEIRENSNADLKESFQADCHGDSSSISLPFPNNAIYTAQENFQSSSSPESVKLPDGFPVPLPNTAPLSNPTHLGQLPQCLLKESLGKETGLLPFLLPDASSGAAQSESSRCSPQCLTKSPLSNMEESGQERLEGSAASLLLSGNSCQSLDPEQNLILPCLQSFEQKDMAEMLTRCDCLELECSHYEDKVANPVSDIPYSPQSLSACHSPVQSKNEISTLTTDFFTVSKEVAKLKNIQPQSESCSSGNADENRHNLPEILNCTPLLQQKATLSSPNGSNKPDPGTAGPDVSELLNAKEANISNSPKQVADAESKLLTKDQKESGTENADAIKNGVLSILDSVKSKEILASLSRSGQLVGKKSTRVQATCDICSISFRSKPGLTRHKAVKHHIKASSMSVVDKAGVIIPENTSKLSKRTSKKLQSLEVKEELLKSARHTVGTFLGEGSVDQELEVKPAEASPRFNKQNGSPDDVHQELPTTNTLNEKAKLNSQTLESQPVSKQPQAKRERITKSLAKEAPVDQETVPKAYNGKVRNSKTKKLPSRSSHSEENTDDLSSELILNIIKTNILNAIVCPKQTSKLIALEVRDQATHLIDDNDPRMDDAGECVSSKDRKEPQLLPGPINCPNQMEDESYGGKEQVEEGWEHVNENDVSEEQPESSDATKERGTPGVAADSNWGSQAAAGTASPTPSIESAKTKPLTDIPEGTWECRSSLAETKQVEQEGKESGPSGLLDEGEGTFSQLFPRDNQCIRRKCTRVYGKGTKKQSTAGEANPRERDSKKALSAHSAEGGKDSCQYKTLSVDDTLILDVCPGSQPKLKDVVSGIPENIALQYEDRKDNQNNKAIDRDNDTMLTFPCQNSHMDQLPNLDAPSARGSSLAKEGKDLAVENILLNSSTELEDGNSCLGLSPEIPDLGEPYDGKTRKEESATDFQAMFEMREGAFFGAGEEQVDQLPASNTLSTKPKTGQRCKQNRNKAEDGKPAKSRSEHIKSKDKQYKCKVCFQWFLTLGELDFHKLSHNPSPPPTCYMCIQRKFSSREQLRDHLKEKHAKNKAGLWICGMCLKEISDVWMYNEHLREHATQFARKGQAQKSVMGLPGCFDEDSAVRTLQSTIIFRKASKSSSKGNKTSKHRQEEQDSKPSKDPLESCAQGKPVPSSSSEVTPSPLPEDLEKTERQPGHKSALIHPLCKDPSRDCHHCGKRFPKPFKLQRHLVVHSLQKIYLCHKCPMFYQDMHDLRSHLKQDHDTAEVSEIKHTTLYACELCADVMHVIKKSFICSTCNYTFSKKEQYDRHMEKHLVGGNKTFKFRGVTRPSFSMKDGPSKAKETIDSQTIPPRKKRKFAHDSATAAMHVDHNGNVELCEKSVPDSCELVPAEIKDPFATESETSVKSDDTADLSDLLSEMETSLCSQTSPAPCLTPQMPHNVKDLELEDSITLSMKEMGKQDLDMKPSVPFPDLFDLSLDIANVGSHGRTIEKAVPGQSTDKLGHADGQEKPSPNNVGKNMSSAEKQSWQKERIVETPCHKLVKKSVLLLETGPGESESKELQKASSSHPNINEITAGECPMKSKTCEAVFPLKDRSASSDLNSTSRDPVSQKKNLLSQFNSRSASGLQSTLYNFEDPLKPYSVKEKATFEMGLLTRDSQAYKIKETGSNQSKSVGSQLKNEVAISGVKHSHMDPDKSSEKQPLIGSPKVCAKKRKEHKALGCKSSSASRENIEREGKRKKLRGPGSRKGDSAAGLRKPAWTNDLSSGREETLCSRLQPRPRSGGHFKKVAQDPLNQKKVDARHANGASKQKKAVLGKTFPQLLPSSSNMQHPAQAKKSAEPLNLRTAESQNSLLSKLFGQKLTSFKIPLRRDTSE